jgi:hypothetical protein
MRSSLATTGGLTLIAAAGLVAIAASCDDRGTPTTAAFDAAHVHVSPRRTGAPEPDLDKKLAELRRSTDRYQRFSEAQADGYTVEVTPCMEDATRGGMGYHFAKETLIDGGVIEARPEVLLYEPHGNGRMRLVGVEFIIPFTAWTATEPPTLYGQTFAQNETFKVWALHVWVWRKNPKGMFADWNPKVDCSRDDA